MKFDDDDDAKVVGLISEKKCDRIHGEDGEVHRLVKRQQSPVSLNTVGVDSCL